MVGRAGRSKGCLSCRKRRVKCDEHKPICFRCNRDGFSCEYRVADFVHFSGPKSAKVLVKQPWSTRACMFSPAPHLSCHNDDTFIAYLRSTLFVVSLSDNSSARTITGTWPGFLVQPYEHPLANQCLVALSQAYFGMQHGAQDVAVRGTELYVCSLGRLNQALGDTLAVTTDDTLLAIMILFLYEMLVLSSHNAWIDHALGLGRVIESRGPESFSEPAQRLLFESNRFIIILASLAASKPTFLSRQEWKRQPWASNPDEKTRLHHLLDMFADLATFKALLVNRSDNSPTLLIINAIKQTVHSLRSWRAAWDAVSLLDVAEVQNQSPESRTMLPTVLRFTSMYTANTLCLYDAIIIQAVRLLGTGSDSMSNDDYGAQMQDAATEILQATEYQMQNADYMTGQFLVLFPLRMAYLALESSGSPLKGWVERTLGKFTASSRSWGVARKLNAYGGNVNRLPTGG